MKNLFQKTFLFCLPVLLILLTTCDALNTENECDRTAFEQSINVQLFYTVYLYEDGEISDRDIVVIFNKFTCGNEDHVPHGHFEFWGNVNSEGYYRTGIVGYNLRNSADYIRISFSVRRDNGTFSYDTAGDVIYALDFGDADLSSFTKVIHFSP